VAASSASALSFSTMNGKYPDGMNASGGFAEIHSAAQPMTCSSSVGSGSFTSSTSGQMTLTLKECAISVGGFPISCTTSGQTAGTVVMAGMAFKPVYLNAAKTKYGLLFTRPGGESGNFAQYSCAGSEHAWYGNGLLSRLSSPALNTLSEPYTLVFETAGASQLYTQVEEAGTAYQLQDIYNGTPYGLGIDLLQNGRFNVRGTFQA